MLKQVESLSALGFAVHWLHPKSKRPIGKDWSEKPVNTVESLRSTYKSGNNVGVRLGEWSKVSGYYLHIIDMDIRKPEQVSAARAKLKEVLPELNLDSAPCVISGSGGESRHFYMLTSKPFPPRKFAHSDGFEMVYEDSKKREVKKWDWELHLLGTGAQAAIPPSIHDKTGQPYKWLREFDTDDLALGLFDTVPAGAVERVIGYVEPDTLDPERLKPLGLSLDEIQDILEDLPVDEWFEDRDGWYRTGMAVHHETSGNKDGYDLWCEYSKVSTKFDQKDAKRVWESFKNKARAPVRMATLKAVVRDVRIDREFEDYGSDLDDDFDDLGDESDAPAEDDIFGDLMAEPPKGKTSKAEQKLNKQKVDKGLGRPAPPWVEKLNVKHGVARVSGRTVIMDFMPDGRVAYGSVTDLHNYYENQRVKTEDKTVPITKKWMQHPDRRSFPNGIVFAPNREVEGAYNHWQGFSVEPDESGSRGCRLFLKHLLNVVCSGNVAHYDYMLGYFAHMIQRPQEKPGVAIVMKGKKGIGKDTPIEYFGRMISNHYITVVNKDQLLGKFNQHQEKCLLLHVQEGFWAGNKMDEGPLKYIITSENVMIEPKGMNAFPIRSVLRVFMSSNERWVVPASEDERRFFVVSVSERHRRDYAYFEALRAEMEGDGPAALLHYLMAYDLTGFQVRNVPDTEALAEQKVQGLKNVERWWLDALERAYLEGADNTAWMSRSVYVDAGEFRDSYSRWMRSRRYDGEEVGECEFGTRMRNLLPGLGKKRVRNKNERNYVYELPFLDHCRKSFETYLGSELKWPEQETEIEIIEYDETDL